MTEIVVRESRVGDGAAFAALWQETGALFAEMNPHTFHVPPLAELAGWFEELAARRRDDVSRLGLVAEVAGSVAGMVSASLHEPLENAERELQSDFGRRRLHVDYLAVTAAHRRGGVGSVLMRAVEEWGRSRGAQVILLETESNNPMSVPFYEQRMGFSAEVVVFRKEITPSEM